MNEVDAIRFHEMLAEKIHALPWGQGNREVLETALKAIQEGRWQGFESSDLHEINEIVNEDDAAFWGVLDLEVLRTCFRNCISIELANVSQESASWIEEKRQREATRLVNQEVLAKEPSTPSVDSQFSDWEEELQEVGLSARMLDAKFPLDEFFYAALDDHFADFLKAIRKGSYTLEQVAQMPPENLGDFLKNSWRYKPLLAEGASISSLAQLLNSEAGLRVVKSFVTPSYLRLGVTLEQLVQAPEALLEYSQFLAYFKEKDKLSFEEFIRNLSA